MAFDTKKFLVRTGSAAVFVVVLLGCILWNYYSFSVLFLVVSLWGLHEFYKLMELTGAKPQKWAGYLIATLGYTFIYSKNYEALFYEAQVYFLNIRIEKIQFLLLIFIFAIALLMPILELFRNKPHPFNNLSITFFGLIYCTLPFILFNAFSTSIFNAECYHYIEYKPTLIVAIFLLIWSNDTFAYLVGSFIGKNKMFERISPGKTWEGTVGGAVLTIATSFLIYKWFGIFELKDWMIIAAIVAVFGTLGDLVESMLKRSVGVKDSGKIMPGHGGILDRFDSLIMVAPFVFLYLILK